MSLIGNAEEGTTVCAVPSCRQPNPKLYDEYEERYFCDDYCLVDYVAENPEEFAYYYGKNNTYELGNDWK